MRYLYTNYKFIDKTELKIYQKNLFEAYSKVYRAAQKFNIIKNTENKIDEICLYR